ncbi:antibiotic ABC transporter permease [Elizabethkingia meningoseptica]|uniref:FtsX-like permease family protein n=1 Tax=Elizabethkingia meningoseptica TaxID=238 RepID=UPI000999B443|nr:FtsX-like permease family protein [Elizabethkingia meningoseptica]OPC20440.1 antibiotic ABC transporter permease [Elizabethkingia meningoseptica]
MLHNWLKIAFTNYRKNWLVSLINLLGLTIGFSIFLLVYLNWQDEKSYENWVPGKENIYFVENGNSVFGKMGVSSYPELYVSKEKFSEIEDYTIANIWGGRARLIYKNQSVYTTSARAVDSYFEFFPYKEVAGSFKNAISDEDKIALSEETAKALFGKAYKECIGKIINEDSKNKSYVITVVYQLPSSNSVFKPGYIIKQGGLEEAKDTWTNYSYMGFFKLKPEADIKNLEKKLTDQLAKAEKINAEKWGEKYDEKNKTQVCLIPLSKMKLDAESDGIEKGDKKSILTLLGLSTLILILSGINLINLKTAQASQRAKEVGVRKAIGSSKWMIIGQFIFENAIICIVAYLLSLVVLEFMLQPYNKFLGKEILLKNSNAILYSVCMLIIFILLSGIIPALYLSNFKPINTLKGNFAGSKHGIWLRNSILILQLIISSFFIICSLVIYTQVRYMMNKDLGFNGDQVIQINFNKSNYEDNYTYKKYLRLRNEVLKISGVEDVTGSVLSIGMGVFNSSSVKNAQDTTKVLNNVVNGGIDYNFFNFYKIKFVAGRDLDIRKASDTMSGVVANEAFVKEIGWNNQQALGKEIYPGWGSKKKYKIIGVIKDFYVNGVDKPVESMLFYNYDRTSLKNGMSNLQVKLSGNDINGTLERIEKFWNTEAEPGYPFEYSFVNKTFAKTFDKYKKQRLLFSILNSVVLVVALLGLFALSSLMIEQKLKDVAIKKTLGASDGVLIIDLTRKFLWITALAVLLSIPVSYYFMNEWLKDFAYRIEMPWWPYILSLIILLLLTFLVVSIKAYRATKVELVRYLKYE